MSNYDKTYYDKLEARVERIEQQQLDILQEIAGFKPLLETLNKNVEKLGENQVDKERICKLENEVDELKKKDADKWNKAVWVVISGLLTAFVAYLIGKK